MEPTAALKVKADAIRPKKSIYESKEWDASFCAIVHRAISGASRSRVKGLEVRACNGEEP